jgi:tRNA threonylcarbamoyladenosine biosynthesis protein TsaE
VSKKSLNLISRNPDETGIIGQKPGMLAQPGDLFLLIGNLGSGKTTLTQGIARGIGSLESALSPTFVLMRELNGRLPLYHIDLYRLDRIEEISDLGLDDYLFGNGLCVIEWAEKGLAVLPPEHLLIRINYLDDNSRGFEFIPEGPRYRKLLRQLKSLSSS